MIGSLGGLLVITDERDAAPDRPSFEPEGFD